MDPDIKLAEKASTAGNSRKRKTPVQKSKITEEPAKKAKVVKSECTKQSKPKLKKEDTLKTKTSKSSEKSRDCDYSGDTNDVFDANICWNEAEMLSYTEKIPQILAENFINLLKEGCTLPFIARYRKAVVDNLMPDKLQNLYDSYQNVSFLKKKIKSVLETLNKTKKITNDIEKSILNARSLSELDLIYAPLKSHSLSLAERARNLGLEPYAIKALNGESINLNMLCTDNEDLSTADKVDAHLTHIVADIIHKDTRVLEQIRSIKDETRFTIQSSRTKSTTKGKNEDKITKVDSKSDPETYKLYFDWKCPAQFIKPHQTLALNRGEDEKILSVKVVIPDWFYNKLERYYN
ncbi:unnamed protein product [Diatraea saccharalis]|uniref:Tex-like protein N-terminal domain-containing protein n=1 Tax=Diatraea saccharalis TaxID=40085 RepID=A0A9N9W7L6_9NEOP|nr:unnamed protein product [Diatraea saccharalis]